ncbi:MAG: FAD-binding oxidoreductase [Gammaproteobacteria bacterium]|nr:FAD-binding oxidoreductase [Gammaproteobacteria bacterium]
MARWAVCDRERLARYEQPERGAPGHAPFALLPQAEDDVGAILRLATAQRVPLVISAGRTGLVEAQRPEGEAVLSLEKLDRPLAFRLADGRNFELGQGGGDSASALYGWWQAQGAPDLSGAHLIVQAGIPVDAVNALLEPLAMMWPLEMGSSSAATAGACVANASAGANAVCYGTAAHLCECAWGFWADGGVAGPCAGPRWRAPAPQALAIDSTRIDSELGLIGSQGLFGVITRLELRLQPRPAARESVLIPLPDMPAAVRLLAAARGVFGGDVEEFEFIGRAALELVMVHLGAAVTLPLPAGRLQPWSVLLQVKSQTDDGAELARRLYAFLSAYGIADDDIGYAPLPVLKRIRHSLTEASNLRLRALGGGRLAFDTAVPAERFGDYLAALSARLAAQHPDLDLIAFGHAGVGGAHLHLLGSRDRPLSVHAAALVGLVFDVTAEFGGTFSAEHGVGPKWAAEFRRRMPAERVQKLAAEKRRRDPVGILNPRSFGLST